MPLRLLNTKTGVFAVFGDPRQVRYAILSYVWSTDGSEQSYERTLEIIADTPTGAAPLSQYSEKIQHFCEVASKDGFEWGWVDSSCIDKTSSSELTEAINSMFDWYRYAGTCYAFLADLHDDIDTSDPSFREEFGNCKWFSRAWTLQELLAPTVLLFLSGTWRTIGSKYTLASVVESVTDIDSFVLTSSQPQLEGVSVARKMSWAASRTATRVEDEAYSLMGIFGVTIPISYGEGRYAFIRLQEEIARRYPDQTIFAWGHILPPFDFRFAPPGDPDELSNHLAVPHTLGEYFLASGPRHFKESSTFQCLPRHVFAKLLGLSPELTYQVFTATPFGMHARVPLLTIARDDPHFNLPTHLALLACEDPRYGLLALLLRPQHQATSRDFLVGAVVGHINTLVGSDTLLQSHYYRLTFISHAQVISLRQDVEMVDLYIPHPPPIRSQKLELEEATHAALRDSREFFEVRLSGWSRTLLAQYGYKLTPTPADANIARHDGRLVLTPSSAPTTSAVVIYNIDEHVTIRIGRCNCALGDQYNLLAVMVSARGRSSSLGEKQFQGQHYEKHHPAHIQSWSFSGGFASKEVHLKSITRALITLRLTFSHDTQNPTGVPRAKVYRLGVEILATPPSKSPLSASPVPIEQEPSSRQVRALSLTQTHSAVPNPIAQTTLPSTKRPPAQESGPRNWTLPTGRPSAMPQHALEPGRQTESQLVPMVQSRNATVTDPGTRRQPSSLTSQPRAPLQTTSSATSVYPHESHRLFDQYNNPSSGHQLTPPDPLRQRASSVGESSFDGGALSAVAWRAPSRRTSKGTPSPVSEVGERIYNPTSRIPILRSTGGVKPVLTPGHRRQPATLGLDRSHNGDGRQRSLQQGTSQHEGGIRKESKPKWK